MAGIMRYVAVLDACVLYPAVTRDILLSLAQADLYHAKWSTDIQREWVENLLANRQDLKREQLEKTCADMLRTVPDGMVKSYQSLITTLELPDEGDRHVLAAAITCNADAIVTFNIKDFPLAALVPHELEAQHPDDFIMNQIDLSPQIGIAAIKAMRTRMRKPPRTTDEFIVLVEQNQLPQTATFLRQWESLV